MKKENQELFAVVGLAAGAFALAKFIVPAIEKSQAKDDDSPAIYAIVKNPLGAYLYTKTSPTMEPLYGHGKNPISQKLENGTYIGKTTGITYNELVQVQTEIDGKPYTYWASGDDMKTVTEAELQNNLLNKSQADLKNIVHSIVNQIL